MNTKNETVINGFKLEIYNNVASGECVTCLVSKNGYDATLDFVELYKILLTRDDLELPVDDDTINEMTEWASQYRYVGYIG
jgi:hypothetical protein